MLTEAIRENKLLRGVASDLLERYWQPPEPIEYEPEMVIFHEGAAADCLYLIEEGTVRISKLGRGGGQETLSYLQRGDFFGEMGLYDRTARSARATAVGRVVLRQIDQTSFEQLLLAAPSMIVTNLLRENVARLRETDARFISEVLEAERLSLVGSMLSRIVHDIRGPLSTIRMAADLLEEPGDEAQRSRYARIIRRGVDRVSDMAQELLDYSRGTTRLSVERLQAQDLIAEIRDEVLGSLDLTNIAVELRVHSKGDVLLDRNRFFRVLLNVVKNAVEAMPTGGRLTIEARDGEEDVLFIVEDTGVGIPSELLPTIFEPFMSHGKAGGTGLGMAIARSVVEAHGGRIEVHSRPGDGTRFTISIPRGSQNLVSPRLEEGLA